MPARKSLREVLLDPLFLPKCILFFPVCLVSPLAVACLTGFSRHFWTNVILYVVTSGIGGVFHGMWFLLFRPDLVDRSDGAAKSRSAAALLGVVIVAASVWFIYPASRYAGSGDKGTSHEIDAAEVPDGEPVEVTQAKQSPPPPISPPRTPAPGVPAGENFTLHALGMRMIWIAPGEFRMGSHRLEGDRTFEYELPAHQVLLTDGFWMGATEVTNAQFRRFRPEHNSGRVDEFDLNEDHLPVVGISATDGHFFCDWLNDLPETVQAGGHFRLPTECEWEFACRERGHARGDWYWGEDEDFALLHENQSGEDDGYAYVAPVGAFVPNELGLHDMLGNVAEWCSDSMRTYRAGRFMNARGRGGDFAVFRGNAWANAFAMDRAYSRLDLPVEIFEGNSYIGLRLVFERTGTVRPDMAWIEPGEFEMGSPLDEPGRNEAEGPRHTVVLSRGYWMGTHEVTNFEFRRFRPSHNSGEFNGHSLNEDVQAVVNVSWEDARAYCDWLSEQPSERAARRRYRLPTEAEWEFACRERGAARGRWFWGDGESDAGAYANVCDEDARREFGWSWKAFAVTDDIELVTHSWKLTEPNALGLCDMLGNVWEWCDDSPRTYARETVRDPRGQDPSRRALRGGAWDSGPDNARAAGRNHNSPQSQGTNYGFRIVCEVHLGSPGD